MTLQSLLGKNYKWWYITKFSVMTETGDKLGFFARYVGAILVIIATNYVWSLTGANSSVFTYLLVGRIYYELFSNNYYYRLSNLIFTGKINKILYPTTFWIFQLFEAIGTRITKNGLSLGGTLIGVIICSLSFAKIDLPNIQNLTLLIPMVCITFVIYQFLGTIVGSIAFWIKNYADFDNIQLSYNQVSMIIAGLIIPLQKMPLGLDSVLPLLPTSYYLHHPMQIYLGKYSQIEILQTFAGGITWCFVLFILARIVFKMGLKRNESVGL